jgi:hypothetical protein
MFFLQLFVEIYPNEEFLPRNSAPQHEDDDSDSAEWNHLLFLKEST